jgi:DNA polymerase type B, organellar and viral
MYKFKSFLFNNISFNLQGENKFGVFIRKPGGLINRFLHNSLEDKQDWVKKKDNDLYFSLEQFLDKEFIADKLSEFTKSNWRYSIIPRMSYVNLEDGEFVEWKSFGEQIGFVYDSDTEFSDSVTDLHKTLMSRFNYLLEIYNISLLSVTGIQFIINKVEYCDKIKPIKLTKESIGDNKDLINFTKISEGFNKLLPLNMDIKTYGNVLNKNLVNNYVKSITLMDGTVIDLSERINKYLDINKNKVKLDGDLQFFQKSLKDLDIIITVKVTEVSNYIDIYSINGMKLLSAKDTKLYIKSNFSRAVGNVVAYINEKGIYNKEIHTKLPPVQPRKVTGNQASMLFKDRRIGTLDLETYESSKNISRVYSAGFYTDNNVNTFYIDETLNSDKLIIDCLEAMLVEKYHRYTFYVHNFGKYDSCFILPVILRANKLSSNRFDYDLTMRDDVIIAMDISKKINNKKYSIKLVDSLNLLQSSLDSLCKTFKTEVKKLYFPYDFVNKNNLFYVGNKPDISYYNINKDFDKNSHTDLTLEGKILKLEGDISTISDMIEGVEFYFKIPHRDWSLKFNTLNYLEHDLISLYMVIEKFQYNIYKEYHTQISQSLTISSLSMNIYLRRFYKDFTIPLINKNSIYKNIRKSYYGGITEVYKPYGKNLFYYDVNSLYPYSALNPMPGLKCVYIDIIDKNISDCIDDLFGFYYCKIETSDKYIGLLPIRSEDGLQMPLGFLEGWYFSEELKFAFKHGYKIQVINGYKFDKIENVFTKYIEEFYRIKSTTKDSVMKSIAKSLLNNFLGKWGLILDKSVTELVTTSEFKKILQVKKYISHKYISGKILLTHGSEISPSICKAHKVDYVQAIQMDIADKIERKTFKNEKFNDVSIAIASAITSYSRIYINQIKLDILDKGGSIFYSDTDSIITDIKLNDSIVGSEIGQFKLEHEIVEGYFIGCKTYGFKNSKGKIVVKSKGGFKGHLNFNDLEKLYLGLNIDSIRYETIRNYSVGSVKINVPKPITLSANMYNKRVKVYRNERWIDTRPIYRNINKIHNSCINSIHLNEKHKNPYNILDLFNDFCIFSLITIPPITIIIVYILTESLYIEYFINNLHIVKNCDRAVLKLVDSIENTKEISISIKNLFKGFTDSHSNSHYNFLNKYTNRNLEFTLNYFKTPPKDFVGYDFTQSKILSELRKESYRFKELEAEITNLREDISHLMMDNLQKKISMLESKNTLNSLIKDVEVVITESK